MITTGPFGAWRFLVALLLLGVLSSLAACRTSPSLDEPPEVRFGVDVCDQCGMIISEPRFAATYVTEDGEARRFESIGDMVKYHQEQQEQVHLFWVHDYYSDGWLRMDQATLVVSERIITPMGDSVLATAGEDDAARLVADGGGTVVTFDELLTAAESGTIPMHDLSGHGE